MIDEKNNEAKDTGATAPGATSLFHEFETDRQAELEGVKFPIGATGANWFYCARQGGQNTEYQKLVAKITKPHRLAIQHGLLSADEQVALLAEAFVERVLKGWGSVECGEGNLPDRNGKPIPYNRENALLLFKKMPDMFVRLSARTQDHENFLVSSLEVAKGN